jgi:hypothetical protein
MRTSLIVAICIQICCTTQLAIGQSTIENRIIASPELQTHTIRSTFTGIRAPGRSLAVTLWKKIQQFPIFSYSLDIAEALKNKHSKPSMARRLFCGRVSLVGRH